MKTARFSCRRNGLGVSLISALFLLLLFAAIAAFMASMMTASHTNAAQDARGVQAEQAARAGIEWALFQMDANGANANLPACAGGTLPTLPEYPGINVTVTCTPYPSVAASYNEGSRSIRIYQLDAIATNGGIPPLGVERMVRVTVEKCRDANITVPSYDCQ